MTTTEETLHCAKHPNRETLVRCGRCDTPVCTDCMIMTPVGVRCRACANVKPLPTYDVRPAMLLRAALVAFPVAIALAYVLRQTPAAAFGFFLAPLYGWLVGEAIARVCNEKRGLPLQLVAGLAIVAGLLLWTVLPLLSGRGAMLTPEAQIRFLMGALANVSFLFQLALALVFGLTRLR